MLFLNILCATDLEIQMQALETAQLECEMQIQTNNNAIEENNRQNSDLNEKLEQCNRDLEQLKQSRAAEISRIYEDPEVKQREKERFEAEEARIARNVKRAFEGSSEREKYPSEVVEETSEALRAIEQQIKNLCEEKKQYEEKRRDLFNALEVLAGKDKALGENLIEITKKKNRIESQLFDQQRLQPLRDILHAREMQALLSVAGILACIILSDQYLGTNIVETFSYYFRSANDKLQP
ncbi:MAG: hypothetical protein H6850_01775 [Alphaproteobacteria bacterium]|nr:MAG: hypothetical protein H6850_01775 [Alphaproteobacteria bacterium]